METVVREVGRLIRKDDWEGLVRVLRTLVLQKDDISDTISQVFKLICSHKAVRCATALLEGEAGCAVDVNVALEGGLPPLHLAAQSSSYSLTKLLLLHGADPIQSWGDDDLANLPLSLALHSLSRSYSSDWTPEKSVFKLFYILCLKELKEPLAIVKLLASRTKQLDKLGIHFVEEGKIIELAALLLVAWHQLVTPYASADGIENSPIGKCILKELKLVSDHARSPTNFSPNNALVLLSERQNKMESAWKIFLLMGSVREDIERFRRKKKEIEPHEVPFHVAQAICIGQEEIVMEPEDVYSDDVKCLMPRLDPKRKAWLNRALEKQKRRTLFEPLEKHTIGTESHSRTFCTFHALNANNDPFDVSSQVTKVILPQAVKLSYRRRLPSAKICAGLVSLAKRIA